MLVLNFILGLLEIAALIYGAYYFMAHTERTIYRKKGWYIAAFAAYIVLLIGAGRIFLDDRISVAVGIVCVTLIGHFLFNPQWRYVIYYVLYMVCIFLGQSIVIWSVRGIMGERAVVQNPMLAANICLMLKILAELGLPFLLTYLSGLRKMAKLTKRQAAAMFLLPVFSMVIMFSMYVMGDLYVQLYGPELLAFNFVLILLANLYFLYLSGYMFQAENLEHELKLFHTQSSIQYQYYSDLEKKYRESRKVLHDMKNHLQAVEQLYQSQEEGKAKDYVEDLYHMLNVLGEKYYSPHKMLNIILNDKLKKAEREGIQVQAAVGDVQLLGMRDMDVTTVFANLLDNAIEAARECAPSGYLHLKMDQIHDFTVVRIVNSCLEEKPKKGHMGLGLENVRNTLAKYHGTMQTERSPGQFRVNITIPLEGGGQDA